MDPILLILFSGEPPSLVLSAQAIREGGTSVGVRTIKDAVLKDANLSLAGRSPNSAEARLPPEKLAVLEGLTLLWHGHWKPAHEIAQSREGDPDHDLLHAILHRREGDFANAGYWFRGAGKHACYPILDLGLASADPETLRAAGLEGVGKAPWSPSAFLAAILTEVRKNPGARTPGMGRDGDEADASLRFIQAEEFRAFAAFLLDVPPNASVTFSDPVNRP